MVMNKLFAPKRALAQPPALNPNHRWIILAIGAVAQASFAAAFAGLPVTGVLMRGVYQMNTAQLGFVMGCMYLGITFSELLWGMLTDLWGDRRILLAGLTLTGAALMVLALCVVPHDGHIPHYLVLGGGLVLVGVMGGSVNSSSGRAVMGWFNDGRRGLAMSIRQTAVPVGGAIGAALLPWLSTRYGFRAVFGVPSLLCFASALLAWRWLHEPGQARGPGSCVQFSLGQSPLARLDMWRVAIASALLTAPQLAVLTFGGVFLHDHKAASLATIAGVIIVVQVVGSIARIYAGRRSDKGMSRRALVRGIGMLAATACACLALLADGALVLVIVLICIIGVAANAWHGVAYTEIAVMAGAERAGTALGLIGMTIFAAAFLTPTLIPVVLGAGSWGLVWGLISLTTLAAVVIAPRPEPHG
ncbi:MFS transporter [Cupriavidus numazuensis]|uniref:MFS-type transporter n=1 Tax=Cupriavidus numazuensis TaxID=221992 RepID=A0ABN7QCY3_9BURK|nr:MFS transporter [Cupriavidus numazuensis]CAG2160385.1 putative MFS-type transporter [Cupriavidus numazuensis]